MASNTTNLHILLHGMLSHNAENVHIGSSLIQQQLESEASPDVRCIMKDAENISEEVKLIIRILAHDPTLATIPGGPDLSLPLHLAVHMGNLFLCQQIYKFFPDAVKTPNSKGKLALHLAARCGHIDVTDFLLQVYPQASSYASRKRKLPLHFSASDGHLTVTRMLLQAYPAGARKASAKGKIALHQAAKWGRLDVVQLLLQVYPEGARCLDWEGSLPLHDASLENQETVAKVLIAAFPEGLQQCNIRGEVPLFAAVRNNNPSMSYAMLQVYPDGGKLVLQNLNENDRVNYLHWRVLELCLRGATGMLSSADPRSYGIDLPPGNRRTERGGMDAAVPVPRYVNMQALNSSVLNQFCTQVVLFEVPSQGVPFPVSASSSAGTNDVAAASSSHSFSSSHAAASSSTASWNASWAFIHPELSNNTAGNSMVPSSQGSAPQEVTEESKDGSEPEDVAQTSSKRSRVDKQDANQKMVVPSSDGLCATRMGLSRYFHDPRILQSARTFTVFLPLHAAIDVGASLPVLRKALENCSDQVYVQDCYGRLPLHLAASLCRQEIVDFIGELVKVYPYGCFARDSRNRLPWHLALQNRAEFKTVKMLMDANVSAAYEVCKTFDNFYNQKPLVVAMCCDCDLDVIYTLLRGDPVSVLDTSILF